MDLRPSIEITEDGSATLRSPLYGDAYHSMRGAVGESRHVFIENGFNATGCDPVRILEAGFGTGLNAWLTLLEATRRGRRVEYTAVELYPVPEEVAAALGYSSDPHFLGMHRAGWGAETEIADSFTLIKINADLAVVDFSGKLPPCADPRQPAPDSRAAAGEFGCARFDLVYYDAFAPVTQPELWTQELFAKIYVAMADGGILVTYSAKGDVKRALRAAGFTVERLPGALGKRHMTKATKEKRYDEEGI